MSNVRSPPPCTPPGGQASDFPFRKGQSEHIKGKWKECCLLQLGCGLATHRMVRRPAGSPACLCACPRSLLHSLIHSTGPSTCLLWSRPCAGTRVLALTVLMVSGQSGFPDTCDETRVLSGLKRKPKASAGLVAGLEGTWLCVGSMRAFTLGPCKGNALRVWGSSSGSQAPLPTSGEQRNNYLLRPGPQNLALGLDTCQRGREQPQHLPTPGRPPKSAP